MGPPRILNIESLVVARHLTERPRVIPQVITVAPTIWCEGLSREGIAPIQLKVSVRVIHVQIFGRAAEVVSRFERMLLPGDVRNVRPVDINVVPRRLVPESRVRAGHVREPPSLCEWI